MNQQLTLKQIRKELEEHFSRTGAFPRKIELPVSRYRALRLECDPTDLSTTLTDKQLIQKVNNPEEVHTLFNIRLGLVPDSEELRV